MALSIALAGTGLACAGPGGSERSGKDVTDLAATLVETARQRVELGQMRVVVRGITELKAMPTNARAQAQAAMREDPIGKMLEYELVIALSSRMNVVESELVSRPSAAVPASNTLADLASSYGATHLVVGTYQRHDDGLIVALRLIDADSHVIVAAARGRVLLDLDAAQDDAWDRHNRWAGAAALELDDQPVELAAIDPAPTSAADPATEAPADAAPPAPTDAAPLAQARAETSAIPSAPAPSTPTAVPSFADWKKSSSAVKVITPSRPVEAKAPAPADDSLVADDRGPAWYWLHAQQPNPPATTPRSP